MKTLPPREGYDAFAKDYRSTYEHLDSFDWESSKALIFRAMDSLGGLGRKVSILDAGCGDGRALSRLMKRGIQKGLDAEYWGWDISPGMLKVAAKRLDAPARLICRDLRDSPSPTDAPKDGFDLVTSFFVMVHMDHPRDFLEPMAGVMAPGSFLVLNNIPQREGFVVGKGKDAFMIDYHHHEADSVADALADTGFDILERQDGEWSALFLARRR